MNLLRLLPLLAAASLSAASVSTFAGNGQKGYSGDNGPATEAKMDNPFGVTRGPDGSIWYCEYTGQRIRKVTPDGKIHLIAGNGQKGYSGDGGPATEATFNLPHELRFGPKRGNLFIVDMMNHVVRKIDTTTGIISTVVGTGKPGYSGDGGKADQAQLKNPHSIQFDAKGDLFICDIGNNVIRKVDMKTHIITTIAGTGKAGDSPDGAPVKGTPIKGPRSIDFDAAGNLWVCTREGNQASSSTSRPTRSRSSPATARRASPATAAPRSSPLSAARRACRSTPQATLGSPTPSRTRSAWSTSRPATLSSRSAPASKATAPTATP